MIWIMFLSIDVFHVPEFKENVFVLFHACRKREQKPVFFTLVERVQNESRVKDQGIAINVPARDLNGVFNVRVRSQVTLQE